MKQTAVEWLIEQLTEIHPKAFEQAKEMEKEQIKNSYHSGAIDGFNFRTYPIFPNAEKYYEQEFKSK